MKRRLLYFVAVAAVIINQSPASAQVDHGAIFSFNIGGAFNYTPSLQKDLNSPQYVGGNVKLNNIVPTYGGGFHILCSNRIVVGGNGYGYALSSNSNDAKIKDKMGAGLVDIGYNLSDSKNKKTLSFVYAGLGGYGTKFSVTNTTTKQLFIDEPYATMPGVKSTYSDGGLAWEVGYSIKYYAFDTHRKGNKRIGPVIGLDAGCQYYMPLGQWRNTFSRNFLPNFARPEILSPFIRLSIGFGDFSAKNASQR